jgi:hypothetical protein
MTYRTYTLLPEYLPMLRVWLVSYWRRNEEPQSVRHADKAEAIKRAKREIEQLRKP